MIKPNDGLFLTGLIVSSDIQKGVRQDDKQAWARRIATISTGKSCVNYSETLDPSLEVEALPLNTRCYVSVNYANTQNGMVSVRGELTLEGSKEAKAKE